jgi:subtilase family serine protease
VGPDLVISAISAPGTSGAGITITVTDTTKNQGGGAADPTTTRFYLSTNTVLDASDVPLGSRAVPALASGASSSGSTAVTIPAGTPSGSYYILAAADADNLVVETLENNNISYAFVQVTTN